MADIGHVDHIFVQNMFAAQQENAQTFEMAMQTGVTMIILQVASGAGHR